MELREKDLLEKLQEKTSDIQVPESLQPENIEQLLEKYPKKRNRFQTWSKGLIAASVLVVCGIVYAVSQRGIGTDTTESAAPADEYSAESVEEDNLQNEESNAEEKAVPEGFVVAGDYEEIYKYVDAYWSQMEQQKEKQKGNSFLAGLFDGSKADAVEEYAAADSSTAMPTESAMEAENGYSDDYSETNVRQEGVDEADVVKTDGRYLYVLQDNGNAIAIIDTKDEKLQQASMIEAGESLQIFEFYVTAQKLVLVARKESDPNPNAKMASKVFSTEAITAVTYDIRNVKEPKKVGSVTQSGNYKGSRMVGGYLYLFSESYTHYRGEVGKPETFIPLVNGEVLKADSIFLPVTEEAYVYQIMTSVHLDEPSEVCDSKAIFTKGGQSYVSNENIYWYETMWHDSEWESHVYTKIRKLSYENGKIEALASGEVEGYLEDSFSIDEYKGNLRVVTSDEKSNNVYVLDEKLKIIGEIEDIAEDERIYSARFMGEIGYFVTFRETDPLFSVDLSNPEKPEIIGELKIPGFSEYLHLFEEGKLLGIGMQADENGVTSGVKLSMFDISDPTDVKEENTYVMENVYDANVFWDHRAVLISASKNIIGFSAYDSAERYYVFSYDDAKGFIKEMEEQVNGNSYQSTRGVYIDDILYVVNGNVVESYDMLNYKKIDDIIV